MGIRGGVPTRQPDWRDRSHYDYTASLSRRGWAWEFLRRNPEFRKASRALNPNLVSVDSPSPAFRTVAIVKALHALEDWGVFYCDDFDKTAQEAMVFWRPEDCPFVISVEAREVPPRISGRWFSLRGLRCRTTIVSGPDGNEHALLFDRGRCVQLLWRGASITEDRLLVTAEIDITTERADPQLKTARRFRSLARFGELRPGLFPPTERADRLRLVLQALDGSLAGARYRDIAARVFGAGAEDWADPRRHAKDRARHAVRRGRALMEGRYRDLLR